ncbi:MAG: RdgB/HAM1 family non-canonical purine NTP pyrophosphatase [Pseudomonadota bacterium]|nr:RdgB/HAM1 family non-canonical purine NTP pyrophosphatase [Pseudomonadota bacterium]HJO36170.1 RdgB/HAM1 family non-canonical purine NTP pyrophosphatase [Gammaproteobacteria bacterium]
MSEATRRVVLASGNAGKLRELRTALAPLGLELVSQAELGIGSPPEPAPTFVENALLKARHAALASGLPAIADDSGLEVDALAGAPGVRSARYAGESAGDGANIARLLAELGDRPPAARGARFHCVLVYLRHAQDPTPIIASGQWSGQIATKAAGEAGFGYDPVFLLPDRNCTAAQLPPAEKAAMSHRAIAVRALLEALARQGA